MHFARVGKWYIYAYRLIWLQRESTASQNLGISDLEHHYLIATRMSIKKLPNAEVSFCKALLDYTQEGENPVIHVQKSIRETQLLTTIFYW